MSEDFRDKISLQNEQVNSMSFVAKDSAGKNNPVNCFSRGRLADVQDYADLFNACNQARQKYRSYSFTVISLIIGIVKPKIL